MTTETAVISNDLAYARALAAALRAVLGWAGHRLTYRRGLISALRALRYTAPGEVMLSREVQKAIYKDVRRTILGTWQKLSLSSRSYWEVAMLFSDEITKILTVRRKAKLIDDVDIIHLGRER